MRIDCITFLIALTCSRTLILLHHRNFYVGNLIMDGAGLHRLATVLSHNICFGIYLSILVIDIRIFRLGGERAEVIEHLKKMMS